MARGLIVFLLFLGLSFRVFSCSLEVEHEIKFDPQNATLGSKNARELVDWFIEKREGVGIESILIAGISIKNDPRSLALSHERMHNIARIIEPINKKNAWIEVGDDYTSAEGLLSFRSNFVWIAIEPTCGRTGTCCLRSLEESSLLISPIILQIASGMPNKFIVAHYRNTFSDRNEAISSMKEIVAARDKMRSTGNQFEVLLLEKTVPIKLDNGAELFKLLAWWYVIAPNKQGGFNLFDSGSGSDFSTLSDAKKFISTFSMPGDAEKMHIFERENVEQMSK